jgi:hypothetical protein
MLSSYYINFFDTFIKASSGQLSNQSNVQQFTRDGNFLHLILN